MQKKLLASIFVLTAALSNAQDAHFTQIYSAPQFINPAFAGFDTSSRVDMAYRLQWPNLSGSFQTTFVGYQHYISAANAYAGLNYTYDRAGALQRSQYSFQYAQNIRLGKKLAVRPAMEISYFERKLDWSQLTFGDMIDPRRGFVYETADVPTGGTAKGFDYSAGLLFYSSSFYLGVSAHHLTQPNESVIGGKSALPMKFGAQVGYTLDFSISNTVQTSITPYFYFNAQSTFNTLMAGINMKFNNHVIVGGGFRKDDAVLMNAGYQHKFFRIMYSYDLTTSTLGMRSGGSHEISAAIFFWRHKANKHFLKTRSPI